MVSYSCSHNLLSCHSAMYVKGWLFDNHVSMRKTATLFVCSRYGMKKTPFGIIFSLIIAEFRNFKVLYMYGKTFS